MNCMMAKRLPFLLLFSLVLFFGGCQQSGCPAKTNLTDKEIKESRKGKSKSGLYDRKMKRKIKKKR